MGKCRHEVSSQSTLRLMQVQSVVDGERSMYSVECTACGRMTDWFHTRQDAYVEAWYGCWMKEE